MDFGGMTIKGNSNSLLEKLHQIPGVSRVDSHRQTAALEKWHISVENEEYDKICRQIDYLLIDPTDYIPRNIRETCQVTDFPIPTRLFNKNTATKTRTSHTATKYTSWLAQSCNISTPLTKIISSKKN